MSLRYRGHLLALSTVALVIGVSLAGAGMAHESRQGAIGSDESKPQVAQSTEDSDSLLTDEDSDSLLTDEDSETPAAKEDGDSLLTDDDSLLTDDDSLLTDDDSLLTDEEAEPQAPEETGTAAEEAAPSSEEQHAALLIENEYPSANDCAECHEKQYREWSVSQHAYAQLSPIFMAMQTAINLKTSGTNGDFCIRCHNPVGMNLGESVYVSNLERPAASREGITCVVCHRVPQAYGKASGRLNLEEGDIFDPVFGPQGNQILSEVLKQDQKYRVNTDREGSGRSIHTEVKKFFQLTTPGFCAACHDVTLLNGFRLEEAFAEFHQSPASKNGVSCQDCHMGKVQGVSLGADEDNYDYGPAAIVGGEPTPTRKLTNHFFAGPDYPIIHPGIFPHNVEAAEFKTLREWLQFDYKAGWGTDAFEDNVPDGYEFPETWTSIDDRYDARDILNEQFERIEWAKERRLEVLRNGFGLSEVTVDRADAGGLGFSLEVSNLTDGHAVPTGFDAERLIYLEVMVHDQDGKLVYQSGDRDPNGDVRDAHSLYVHNGDLPLDEDLFSLQSKFVVRLFRGGEREQVLAVNESVSVLPFVRPETRATTIYGRPLGARKHKQTIEPGGSRHASYRIGGDELSGPGTYDVSIKLISQMVPVNLLAAIQLAGFDYGMSPKEIGDAVVAGSVVIAERHLKINTQTGEVETLQASARPTD